MTDLESKSMTGTGTKHQFTEKESGYLTTKADNKSINVFWTCPRFSVDILEDWRIVGSRYGRFTRMMQVVRANLQAIPACRHLMRLQFLQCSRSKCSVRRARPNWCNWGEVRQLPRRFPASIFFPAECASYWPQTTAELHVFESWVAYRKFFRLHRPKPHTLSLVLGILSKRAKLIVFF